MDHDPGDQPTDDLVDVLLDVLDANLDRVDGLGQSGLERREARCQLVGERLGDPQRRAGTVVISLAGVR
jgi:hypothetical protein